MNPSKENTIPKVIHYCWFGGKEKPDLVKKCINSWYQQLSDYEIKEWNESNFDFSGNGYAKEAYEQGKFAFVSDYVRVFVLYHYGGIYLDTDVEVFQSFDAFLHHDSFWGFEQEDFIATSTMGAKPNHPFIKQFLESYKERTFLKEDGNSDSLTNVAVVTEMFQNLGLKKDGTYQEIDGLGAVYPQTYLSPYDYINCRALRNDQTVCMHHFYKSWLPMHTRVKSTVKKIISKIFGADFIYAIRKTFNSTHS